MKNYKTPRRKEEKIYLILGLMIILDILSKAYSMKENNC